MLFGNGMKEKNFRKRKKLLCCVVLFCVGLAGYLAWNLKPRSP